MALPTTTIKCIDHPPLLAMLLGQEKFVLPAVYSIAICIGLAPDPVKFPSTTIGVLIVSLWLPYCAGVRLSPASLFQIRVWDLEDRVCQALLLLDFN